MDSEADISEATDAVLRSEYFSGLGEAEARQVAALAGVQQFPRRELLMNQSDEARTMYFLLEGRAEVLLGGHAQDAVEPIAVLQPGEIVGERALLGGRRRSATVRAKDDVRALKWQVDDLILFMAKQPKVGLKLMRSLALKLSDRLDASNNALRSARL